MRLLLIGLMGCLLLRAPAAMDAASCACRLFATAVLPGLMPYMVLSLMLVSRFHGRKPSWLLILLGWGGGSPTGARLLAMTDGLPRQKRLQIAAATATMSPMFLLGTCGGWLDSAAAGGVLLMSVVVGGGLTGVAAGMLCGRHDAALSVPLSGTNAASQQPMTFGAAVEQAAKTMLLVCGTMVMLRVFATLLTDAMAMLARSEAVLLAMTTLMEVTTGVQKIAALPWPLALRTALIAGATGFGGMASVMQNRALYPQGLVSLPAQLLWQGVHGMLSFLLALGLMQLAG